jgi:lipoprotein-anchoring transpeptidase ErfK/SrfK
MKKIITILTISVIAFIAFNQEILASETQQTNNSQNEDQKYWSYYRSSQRDLSGEVFNSETDCMTASSNNPFADKTSFDSTWQNCFLSNKDGKPTASDEYSFRETGGAISVTPQRNVITDLDKYTLLAPFVGFTEAPEQIGDYLNKIFILAIGLCVALAVLMMIIAGVQYMGEESIFGKVNAKGQIKNALFGLLIALSAYALLNTVDPRLLGKGGVSIRAVKSIIVNLPDVGDGTVDKNCAQQNATYSTNYGVSGGVSSAITKIKSGFELFKFEVDSSTNEMTLVLKRTSDGYLDRYSKIKISPGAKGYSEIGKGVSRDFKTPKGTWKVLSKTEIKEKVAVCSGSGSNMGAGFWKLNPTTNGERGIGIHGNETGTRTTTAGCIRITNSDILALDPYIKVGLTVEIK